MTTSLVDPPLEGASVVGNGVGVSVVGASVVGNGVGVSVVGASVVGKGVGVSVVGASVVGSSVVASFGTMFVNSRSQSTPIPSVPTNKALVYRSN